MQPHVVVNVAMSADGKIALPTRRQTRISDEEDVARVHRLRAAVDAVLVGVGTVLADDPKLTVNPDYAPGPSPLRVVLDSDGNIPSGAQVLNGTAPTLIATNEACRKEFSGAEVVRCGPDEVDLPTLMDHLAERGVRTLLVEGGATVIWSFLRAGLVAELKMFVASMVIGGEGSPTPAGGSGARTMEDVIPLALERVTRLGSGVLLEYRVVG